MLALADVDRRALSGPVSAALGSASIELLDWHQEAIHVPFNQATQGLYRLTGHGRDRDVTRSWSLILKLVHASDGAFGGSDDPTDANYWKRELLLYRSGLLDQLPAIRAPRCFGVELIDESLGRIWLEDVSDPVGSVWPLARYDLAAGLLGEFNGAYLSGEALPTASSLSRHWLRAFVFSLEPSLAQLGAVQYEPIVRRCWPRDHLRRLTRLWEDREVLLDALERLPQTFCHLDAFPGNLLITSGEQEVVAVDWSFAGYGAVGSELASMAAAAVCFGDAEPDQLSSIDERISDGYLAGLRTAGWRGSPALARLGQTAAAALHYGLFPMGIYLLSEDLRGRFEHVLGRSATDIADRWAEVSRFLFDLADEARALVATVGFLEEEMK